MSSMRSNQLSYASVTDNIIAHHESFVKGFLKSFLRNFEIFLMPKSGLDKPKIDDRSALGKRAQRKTLFPA